ncbi:MAG: family 43 glycosylhydrolase [Clostridiales bacterium]|nr:family 43 glycosylhydrolase [Clostridiales bacterium]
MKTELGFDPGILVDDDGRVYAYWGFCESHAGELNDDMATLKKETVVHHLIGHCHPFWIKEDDGHVDAETGFFEASSPRKINGKYVLVYSKRYEYPREDLGVVGSCNGFLSYVWSDTPLGGFKCGGDISFNGGEIVEGPEGGIMTYQWGNNHGSLMKVGGQWYIFYHRQEGCDEYARQAMVEPVDIAVGADGTIYIGKITYEGGEPVSSDVVEMTSQGFFIGGLDAYSVISAGYACHIYDGTRRHNFVGNARETNESNDRPHVQPVYEGDSAPVVNIISGTTVGFRYLQFGSGAGDGAVAGASRAVLTGSFPAGFKVEVRLDSYDGACVGSVTIPDGDASELEIPLTAAVAGKHAVYFAFETADSASMAVLDTFCFE